MFLKINYEGKVKKIKYKEDYKRITDLKALCAKVTGWEPDGFIIHFIDTKNNDLCLESDEDIEYFINQTKGSTFINLTVNKVNKSNKHSIDLDRTETNILMHLSGRSIEQDNTSKITKDNDKEDLSFSFSKSFNMLENQMKGERDLSDNQNSSLNQTERKYIHYTDSNDIKDQLDGLTSSFDKVKIQYNLRLDALETSLEKACNTLLEIKEVIELQNNEDKNRFIGPSKKVSIHYNVKCMKCRQCPILGRIYTCIICDDFNSCEECYSSITHRHELYLKPEEANEEFKNTEQNLKTKFKKKQRPFRLSSISKLNPFSKDKSSGKRKGKFFIKSCKKDRAN